jgi:membrane-associated phospholipid phosphatase
MMKTKVHPLTTVDSDPIIRMLVIVTIFNAMLGRVYFTIHFVGDTLVGLFVGLIVAKIVFTVF